MVNLESAFIFKKILGVKTGLPLKEQKLPQVNIPDILKLQKNN
jgi:hypothetical protein